MKNSDTAMMASKEKESSNSIFPENTDADKFQPAAPSGSVVNEVLKPHMSSLATEDDKKEDMQMAPGMPPLTNLTLLNAQSLLNYRWFPRPKGA
jgi:hypothetical protein